MSSERLVVNALLHSEEFAKKTIAFIKEEYFELGQSRKIFEVIKEYYEKYKSHPNRITVETSLHNSNLPQDFLDETLELVDECYKLDPPTNIEWSVNTAEEWCKDRALFNAINRAIAVYDGTDKKLQRSAIPTIVSDALSVCFDRSLGHDFWEDAEARYDFYTMPENKVPFKIDVLNEVTNNGVTRKSLNIIAAGINVGKSLCLCSLAADYMRSGYDVLYITCEMREELMMQRIDANVLNTDANSLIKLGKENFINKIVGLRQKSYGNIKIKEYSPSTFTSLMLDNLLDEYLSLEKYDPTIILVDYIQICASYKLKNDVQSYHYYKSVAEELRGVAVRRDKVLWTVSQFNRGGNENSDPRMTDTGESMGIPATADGMWAVMRTEELDQIGQLSWKQLKSRYSNKATKTYFLTGVDVEKFRILNVEDGMQQSVAKHVKQADNEDMKSKFSKLKFNS